MPVRHPVYQEVVRRLRESTQAVRPRVSSVERLALLVTGIIAAKTCVLAQVAAELDVLGLTRATSAESSERRLRRTLNDARLTPANGYLPVVRDVLDWDAVRRGRRRIVLIVDESSQAEEIHLLQVSLAYWGGALPLAWAVWEENRRLEAGQYWAAIDAVLDQVATLLPLDLEVVVLADRA